MPTYWTSTPYCRKSIFFAISRMQKLQDHMLTLITSYLRGALVKASIGEYGVVDVQEMPFPIYKRTNIILDNEDYEKCQVLTILFRTRYVIEMAHFLECY